MQCCFLQCSARLNVKDYRYTDHEVILFYFRVHRYINRGNGKRVHNEVYRCLIADITVNDINHMLSCLLCPIIIGLLAVSYCSPTLRQDENDDEEYTKYINSAVVHSVS